MADQDPKPWENLADEPHDNWRERKGKAFDSEGDDRAERGEKPRNEKRDGDRKGRGGYKDDRGGGYRRGGKFERGSGGNKRGGFGGRGRDGGRGDRFERDDRGGRYGREDRGDWKGGSRQGRSNFGDRGGKRDFGRGGDRRDYGRDEERRDYGRGDFRNDRGKRSGRNYEGGYGYSRMTPEKRGQGSTGRTRHLDIPATITWDMLDKEAWSRLSPLPKETAEKVARHLVMSGELVDTQPELAYEHARAALKMAWRIDVVREAVALTAYACGKYAEALREVKTARRMSGIEVLKSVEADSERGLGRPEKALEIIKAVKPEDLDRAEYFELVIVESASRADLGESETGLAILEPALRQVDPKEESFEYGRLLSVKADRLRELGRDEEAEEVEALIPREPEEVEILDIQEAEEAEQRANPTTMKGANVALTQLYPLLLTDLDGVTWNGDAAVEGAAEGITTGRELGGKFLFLTNNAARKPEEVVEKLQGVGITAEAEDIVTSAQDGAAKLATLVEPGAKVLCVGGDGVSAAAAAAGFEPVKTADENPAGVLQGLGFNVDWAELSEACYAIENGATWVATNLDYALPTEKGRGIGNGSFVEAVRRATKSEPIVCGKPETSIYDLAIDRSREYLMENQEIVAAVQANEEAATAAREQAKKAREAKEDYEDEVPEPTPEDIAKEKEIDRVKAAEREHRVLKRYALAIGDQLATDIVGANNAQIDACVVMTGLTKPRDLVMAPPSQRPAYVALDLSDLAVPLERPELRSRGWWYTENTRARVNNRDIEVRGLGILDEDGTEVSLGEFRAILAAVWYAREQGDRVNCPDFKVVREVQREFEEEDDFETGESAEVTTEMDEDTEVTTETEQTEPTGEEQNDGE